MADREGRDSRPGVSAGQVSPAAVRKLSIFVGTTFGGYVGWAIPDYFGASFFVCFLVSGVGSIVGVWAGWKLALKLEE